MKAGLSRRLWQPLKVLLGSAVGPRMVGGYIRGDGEFLPHTRLSSSAVVFARKRLMIGDHVFIGHFSVIDATYGLSIGEGCQVGFFTGIFTHSSHAAIRLYGRAYVTTAEKKAYFTSAVEIGSYTFIGAHATVLPGTRIGKGCIVSAYSLVSGSFADFSIIAGNPAKLVGDTRRADRALLARHPELRPHYEAWAGSEAAQQAPTAGP
ncbi:MAG: acyltransferase [Ideonella sp.]|nr:acyltransferase [Ideonella sp.]